MKLGGYYSHSANYFNGVRERTKLNKIDEY